MNILIWFMELIITRKWLKQNYKKILKIFRSTFKEFPPRCRTTTRSVEARVQSSGPARHRNNKNISSSSFPVVSTISSYGVASLIYSIYVCRSRSHLDQRK